MIFKRDEFAQHNLLRAPTFTWSEDRNGYRRWKRTH